VEESSSREIPQRRISKNKRKRKLGGITRRRGFRLVENDKANRMKNLGLNEVGGGGGRGGEGGGKGQ